MSPRQYSSEFLARDGATRFTVAQSPQGGFWMRVDQTFSPFAQGDVLCDRQPRSQLGLESRGITNLFVGATDSGAAELARFALETVRDIRIHWCGGPPPAIEGTEDLDEVELHVSVEAIRIEAILLRHQRLHPALRLRASPIHGIGVFTTIPIAEGSDLFHLPGEVVRLPEGPLTAANFEGEWNAISGQALLLRRERTSYGFMNHSRDPNCVIAADARRVWARRDIAAGEELTLDYRAQPLPERYLELPGAAYL